MFPSPLPSYPHCLHSQGESLHWVKQEEIKRITWVLQVPEHQLVQPVGPNILHYVSTCGSWFSLKDKVYQVTLETHNTLLLFQRHHFRHHYWTTHHVLLHPPWTTNSGDVGNTGTGGSLSSYHCPGEKWPSRWKPSPLLPATTMLHYVMYLPHAIFVFELLVPRIIQPIHRKYTFKSLFN